MDASMQLLEITGRFLVRFNKKNLVVYEHSFTGIPMEEIAGKIVQKR